MLMKINTKEKREFVHSYRDDARERESRRDGSERRIKRRTRFKFSIIYFPYNIIILAIQTLFYKA